MFRGCDFRDSQPPLGLSFEAKFHPMTVEQLRAIRSPPSRPLTAHLVRFLLFLVIGVPRAIIAFCYAFIATLLLDLVVTLWHLGGAKELYRRPLQTLCCAVLRIFLFILGFVRISFHGELDPEARILVSNHLCFFDNWLFLPLFLRPMDKVETLNLPAMKSIWDVFRGISVDRARSLRMSKHVVFETAQDSIAQVIQMFPEGTTTNGEYMLKFHTGAFLSDLPVQPAAIRYSMWGSSRKFASLSYFHRTAWDLVSLLSIPVVTVDVTFLECCSLKASQQNDARLFADDVSMKIAEFLRIPVMDISSSALFKKKDE